MWSELQFLSFPFLLCPIIPDRGEREDAGKLVLQELSEEENERKNLTPIRAAPLVMFQSEVERFFCFVGLLLLVHNFLRQLQCSHCLIFSLISFSNQKVGEHLQIRFGHRSWRARSARYALLDSVYLSFPIPWPAKCARVFCLGAAAPPNS